MIPPPGSPEVLLAVARFLEEDLRPALAAQPALAYRTAIAAGLARSVAADLVDGGARERRELEGLSALVGGTATRAGAAGSAPAPLDCAERAELARLEAELAARVRAGPLDGPALARARAHVAETLARELAITSPRFDPKAVVE